MPTSLETEKCQAALCTRLSAQRCAADAHGWARICKFIKLNIFRQNLGEDHGWEVHEIKGFRWCQKWEREFHHIPPLHLNVLHVGICWFRKKKKKSPQKNQTRPKTMKIRVRKEECGELCVSECVLGWSPPIPLSANWKPVELVVCVSAISSWKRFSLHWCFKYA